MLPLAPHTVILLNGASSAGKTTLCKQLQIVLDEPYMHLPEDVFVFNTYHEQFTQPGIGEHIFAITMLRKQIRDVLRRMPCNVTGNL